MNNVNGTVLDEDAGIPDVSDQRDEPEVRILEPAEAKIAGVPLFSAHWHLFVPTIVIAVLYSVAWVFLAVLGQSDSAIARLFVVVMAVGVPLLAVHAFLRFETIRLQVSDGKVQLHTGWPKELPVELAPEMIKSVEVKRGLSGRIFGGGTLVFQLMPDTRIVVADIGDPDAAAAEVRDLLGRNRDPR